MRIALISGSGLQFRFAVLLLPVLAAGILWPVAAGAWPLAKDDCEKLAGERVALARQGIEKAIVKGPAWTRKNMPEGTLQRVERYLTVEGQLRFRCHGVRLPDLTPDESAQEVAPASEPEKAAAVVAPVQPEPAAKPRAAPVVAPAPKQLDLTTPAEVAPKPRDATTATAEVPLPGRRPAPSVTRFSPPARKAPEKKQPKAPAPPLHQQFFNPGDQH